MMVQRILWTWRHRGQRQILSNMTWRELWGSSVYRDRTEDVNLFRVALWAIFVGMIVGAFL